jgi:Holliday junction resolvase RusA-like endonuclease
VTDIRRFVGEVLGSNWVPLAGPLAITVVAYRRPPISLSKQRLAAALPTQRPDADNYLKLILDALSPGADGFPGIWADDAQICTIHAHKRYAIGGLLPGWDVRVDHLASSAAASPAPVAVSEYSNWQPPEAAARYLVEASWGG